MAKDGHECKHGFEQEDAVFLKKLRSSTESMVSMIARAVLGLIGLGLVLLIVIGVIAVGLQVLQRMGIGG